MDRDQVITEARRLADHGDYEAMCVLRWLSAPATPSATMPGCFLPASDGFPAGSTTLAARR